MKMICKHKCFFNERSVKKDDVVDIPENLLKSDIVKSSFKAIEGDPAPAAPAKPQENDLTDAEMVRRLTEWGVNVPSTIKPDGLKKLYLSQLGAHGK